MVLNKACKLFSNNFYLIIGVIIGTFLNLSITNFECTSIIRVSNDEISKPDYNYSTIKTEWKLNATRKSTRQPAKLVRPRYYSTELGIREKLFIGVFTAEEKLEAQAVHLNRSVNKLVDQIKFFITAQHKFKNKLNYSGLIGFTDTRHRFRPFQIVKYVADNFLQDYDYYFLMNDFNYLNARRLREIAEKISVSMHVYLGNPVVDSSYCNLDSGILISNSVLSSMKEHLDWCVMNAVTDDHSENIGRCIYHSTKLECQQDVQGQSLATFKLKNFELAKSMERLIKNDHFNKAVTVYPVLQGHDFYLLNAYFCKQKLMELKKTILTLSEDLTESWPAGERIGSTPATRFDLLQESYFNMTHMFFPDDFTVIREHKVVDLQDIQQIIEYVKAKHQLKHHDHYEFRRLVNGYRKFDLARGLDYRLDLGFRDLHTGKEVIKRFEVCKPLGNVDFIPAPYVTENAKVTILLPIQEHEVELAKAFMRNYVKNVMDKREKTLLMLVFLYQYNSSSKGKADVFGELKEMALKYSSKYRSEDTKVAWVSIRLPATGNVITLNEYKVLTFVVIELALKKVGLESLILVLSVHTDFNSDFLNRVRMNTVANFQIFSPIPFRFYDPNISSSDDKLEINKNSGHFDNEEYSFISFYAKDYVHARKRSKNLVPLCRSDNDIANVIGEQYRNIGNVFDVFVQYSKEVHSLRAPDMSLRVLHHEEADETRRNWFMGTQMQLAKWVLNEIDSSTKRV